MNVPKSPTKRTLQQQAKLQQQADEAAKQLDAGRMKLVVMLADRYARCGHDAALFFYVLDSDSKGLVDGETCKEAINLMCSNLGLDEAEFWAKRGELQRQFDATTDKQQADTLVNLYKTYKDLDQEDEFINFLADEEGWFVEFGNDDPADQLVKQGQQKALQRLADQTGLDPAKLEQRVLRVRAIRKTRNVGLLDNVLELRPRSS
jgi:hypothetical protein